MNQQKVESFAERILTEVNSSLSCLNVYLGHKLGLFKNLAETGAVTSVELSQRTGYAERYLREWLECMTAGEYLEHDATTGKFSLPVEHATVLVEADDPNYAAPFTQFAPSLSSVLPDLMEAFRTGGGVPYESYGQDCLEAIGMGNRPMYVNDYASKWIPAMPDVERTLKQGGKVAEVGCGLGWSSISLARGFPRTTIDSIDVDEESIRQARNNASQEGVADRVRFLHSPIEDLDISETYDLVTAFECLHDMPYPVQALRRMREMAGPNGSVLIADEAAGESLEENRNLLGSFYYNCSVLHCLPQALVTPGAAGTGTAIKPSTVRQFATEAGFRKVEVLDVENPFFRFYRLTP